MYFGVAIALHLLATVIWIGGMFFAYVCLRPSLRETLEPPQAARLLAASLGRFFRWVWVAVVVLLLSGFYMALVRYGFGAWPWWLLVMIGLGLAMMALFMHIFFSPYKRLRRGLDAGDDERIRATIGQIRQIVLVNLLLGVVVAVVASAGRYM